MHDTKPTHAAYGIHFPLNGRISRERPCARMPRSNWIQARHIQEKLMRAATEERSRNQPKTTAAPEFTAMRENEPVSYSGVHKRGEVREGKGCEIKETAHTHVTQTTDPQHEQ